MANNITILDFGGTSRILKTTETASVHTPHHNIEIGGVAPALGAGAAGSSAQRVVTSTDDAIHGALAETAPASDTASSGLNGRLQRIAQRITSLIALLPTSIGTKTAALSLAVTLASDGPFVTQTGALTETAPASDTASSGLNGRLQRIAQRISTLIAPAATDSLSYPLSISRIISSAASNNATSAKASAGRLFHIFGENTNAARRYLKLYNKATAPAPASDTPVLTLSLLPTASFSFNIPRGLNFSTGIAYALVTGNGDTDNTSVGAGDILGLNVLYA